MVVKKAYGELERGRPSCSLSLHGSGKNSCGHVVKEVRQACPPSVKRLRMAACSRRSVEQSTAVVVKAKTASM